MEHKLIDDPFYKTQVNNVSWLANADVVYHTTFQMPDNLDNEYTELVFEGIDTYSTVILNGKEILTTNNAFVKYTLPI
jgi:beta-mannosidase